MLYSLNCLVLGQAPTKIFSIFYGVYFPIRDLQVKFDELTVSGFKEALSEKIGITEINVWKVKLGFHEIKNISTIDDIKNRDDNEKFDDDPMLNFNHIMLMLTTTKGLRPDIFIFS
ncbi:5589_t:CDS:1 [Funneliformis mosseae]|uniref:5589_t:CDS:1 n=1 Tax=Funneliformis mosseae TaxID=27381 RepID=A0A9N9FTP1_FUNMO|nr:5589_t:CDS:1 [Funneliformis mosseae]